MNLFCFNSSLARHGPMGCSSTRLQSKREGTVQSSSTTENLIQTLCNILNATQIAPEPQLLWIIMRIMCLCTFFLKEEYSQDRKCVIIYAPSKLLCCHFEWEHKRRHLENVYTALFHPTTSHGEFIHIHPKKHRKRSLFKVIVQSLLKSFNSFVRCYTEKLILLQISALCSVMTCKN